MALIDEVKAKLTPEIEKHLFKLWNEVCDKLQSHYLAMRPKPKVYELHHSNEVAREAFLKAFVAGAGDEEMKQAAFNRIGVN